MLRSPTTRLAELRRFRSRGSRPARDVPDDDARRSSGGFTARHALDVSCLGVLRHRTRCRAVRSVIVESSPGSLCAGRSAAQSA